MKIYVIRLHAVRDYTFFKFKTHFLHMDIALIQLDAIKQ